MKEIEFRKLIREEIKNVLFEKKLSAWDEVATDVFNSMHKMGRYLDLEQKYLVSNFNNIIKGVKTIIRKVDTRNLKN